MISINKIYDWLHKRVSVPEERDQPSGGWWHNMVRQEVVGLISKYDGSILEAGCGEGLFLLKAASLKPQVRIFGVDTDLDKLFYARSKFEEKKLRNIRLCYSDAAHIPFKEGLFDAVVCINTFLNMDSIDTVEQVLSEMSRVCKRDGVVIFDFRNSRNPFLNLKYILAPYYDATIKSNKLPLKTYSPVKIKGILDKLNLRIVNKTYMGFFIRRISPIIIIEARKC